MKPHCPQLNKSCIESKCAAWMQESYIEDNKPKVKFACSIYFWVPLYLRTIANRTDGTQIAVETMRNEMHAGNEAFNLLASKAQEIRQLTNKG